jgi:4'-phosphopantetheinyl transferase
LSGIEWLFGPPIGGVPESPESWLSAVELERLACFRFAKRRSDWLQGRYTAKSLVASALEGRGKGPERLRSIEIVPEPSGAPVARDTVSAAELPVSVSLSHSAGRSLAALLFTDVPEGKGCTMGTDLELVEPRSDGFIRDFLTDAERAEVTTVPAPERASRASGIWSAKEAVLKALRLGLTVDTWKVECLLEPREAPDPGALVPAGPSWRRFGVRFAPEILPAGEREARFLGFWREEDGFVLTLAVALVGQARR